MQLFFRMTKTRDKCDEKYLFVGIIHETFRPSWNDGLKWPLLMDVFEARLNSDNLRTFTIEKISSYCMERAQKVIY